MRYEAWDVLLFEDGDDSSTPIQEFKTQCFVIKDTESPYLYQSELNPGFGPYGESGAYGPMQGSYGQIPVVTTFIPSLPKDTAFRVSIHNWEQMPKPSALMESLLQRDDHAAFEARVLIDGVVAGGSMIPLRPPRWPFLIDLGNTIDRNGNQDNLRFPAFHSEILRQQTWDSRDLYGRIRVIISEGYYRPLRSPPFQRVKDILALSFQHAPLDILEAANVAYPNPGMWCQTPRPMFPSKSSSGQVDSRGPTDAHAHSPRKPEPRTLGTAGSNSGIPPVVYTAWARTRPFPVPQWQLQASARANEQRSGEPFMSDPATESLVNEAAWNHRGARSSREDVAMPDYSTSSSSRAISSMTGLSYEHSKQPSITAPMDDDEYNLLVQALTPTKATVIGTRAPSNTPLVAVAEPKLSAAAEARSASYNRRSTRGSALREISQPSTRDVSGTSAQSNPSENKDPSTPSKLGASPSSNVKGRKEGSKENAMEMPKKNKENTWEVTIREGNDQLKSKLSPAKEDLNKEVDTTSTSTI